jgi:protein gp37
MSDGSAIEWTDATWNPVRGCTKISPGCRHCYAETFSERVRGVPDHPFEQGFDLRLVPGALELPLRWRASRRIFVNSMSDLFHDDVPPEFIERVFDVMRRASQHIFQILTKRASRMAQLTSSMRIPANVWMGVSVENAKYTSRIDDLRGVKARVLFLSVEPLLGPIPALNLRGIHWVIVGGESGPGARRMDTEWVRAIRDRCVGAQVPFFFKQWGGVRKHTTGRMLDGRTWDEMPDHTAGPNRVLAVVNG